MKNFIRKQGTESCNIHILLDLSSTREISKSKLCLCLGLHGFFFMERKGNLTTSSSVPFSKVFTRVVFKTSTHT